MFKINDDMITGVEATFIAAPYYMRSPWTEKPDKRTEIVTFPAGRKAP